MGRVYKKSFSQPASVKKKKSRFQYFNCPSCLYKSVSKQDFVCHAFNTHPESTEYFKNISDKSLSDVLLPWMEDEENFQLQQKVKIEYKEDNNINNEEILDFDSGFHQNHPPNDRPEGLRTQKVKIEYKEDVVSDEEILDFEQD